MLSKLLKYDFKALFRVLIPLYGVGFLLALLTRLTNTITTGNSILAIPNGFISSLFVMVLIGIPFLAFIISIMLFYQNLIKDEGYLMNTLPVKKSSLVISKGISACVVLLLSVVVSIALLFVGVYGLWFHGDLISEFAKLYISFGQYKSFTWLILIAMLLSYIMQQFMFYGAIALGQKHNNKKVLYSVIYVIVLYSINQIASTIVYIPILINPQWSKYLNNTVPPINILNGYMIATIVLLAVFIIIYYMITVKVLDKKLNLE